MAWTPEAKEKMEAAAAAAIAEFEANIKVSKAGAVTLPSAQWLVDWIANNKNSAGYRRLCRYLIQYATPQSKD